MSPVPLPETRAVVHSRWFREQHREQLRAATWDGMAQGGELLLDLIAEREVLDEDELWGLRVAWAGVKEELFELMVGELP